MSRPGLIAVNTAVAKEFMIDRIAGRAAERAGTDATPERLGYETRMVEAEMFEPARQPATWLGAELHDRMKRGVSAAGAVEALSAELAASEPEEKPRPDDERAASWRVPGPGGHVRHFVAARLGAAKREFMLGFFTCCCEEALGSEPGAGPGDDGPNQPPARSPAGGGSSPPPG